MRPACPAPRPRPQGFTLLEISIALFIMVVLMGLCLYSFAGLEEEQMLKHPAREFEKMTLEAMRRAALHEKPQVIRFDASGFTLHYRQDPDGLPDQGQAHWARRVTLPADMRLSLRRWGAAQFTPASGQRLVIAPGGLCEPVVARFELNQAWIEVGVDPLTGRTRDLDLHLSPGS